MTTEISNVSVTIDPNMDTTIEMSRSLAWKVLWVMVRQLWWPSDRNVWLCLTNVTMTPRQP